MTGSGFHNVDGTNDPSAYIRRLDETAAHDFWRAVKHRMLALLRPRPGDRVLDVGCGTGDDVRVLAALVGPTGRVVGVDASATMVAEARKRAEGLDLPLAYCQGDAHHLDFPDESFDACRAERILQHLDDPAQALREMVRVMRSGGQVVAVEPDYGAMTISGADRELTRTILNCRREHFRSGRIGRQLPALFRGLQLIDVAVTLLVMTSTDLQGDERRKLSRYVDGARKTGLVSEAEGSAWLTDLHEASRLGRYRHAIPVVLTSGRKP